MPDKDLQIGQFSTKDQRRRLMWKALSLLPGLCMLIAGVSMARIRYEDTGRLTAMGWVILGALIGLALTGVVWWQVGRY